MTSQKRVLVVDDEESVRDVLTRFFENERFEVDEAADGTAALDTVKRAHFDVVVTDLKMPGPSGLEVLKEIKRRTPKTVVVVFTAYPTPETTVRALELCSDAYITKPIKLSRLRSLISRSLMFRDWKRTSPSRAV